MPFFTHYGQGQRIAFIIVCIGFSLCLIGSIAPYWITAQASIKDLTVLNDVADHLGFGDAKLFDLNVGVWYYCVDYVFDHKCVSLYESSDYKGPGRDDDNEVEWISVVRGCVVINLILGLLSGLVACCRCMCCSGGRTIFHGFVSFFAGAFGLAAFGTFANNTKSLLNVPILDVDYAWAGGLYALGSCLLIIASFVLCCALPKENPYGVVVAAAAPTPGISVNVSNTNTNVNQINAGGSIQSFEPLPHAPGPQQPQHHGFQPVAQHPPPYNYNQPGYNYNNADHTYVK